MVLVFTCLLLPSAQLQAYTRLKMLVWGVCTLAFPCLAPLAPPGPIPPTSCPTFAYPHIIGARELFAFILLAFPMLNTAHLAHVCTIESSITLFSSFLPSQPHTYSQSLPPPFPLSPFTPSSTHPHTQAVASSAAADTAVAITSTFRRRTKK